MRKIISVLVSFCLLVGLLSMPQTTVSAESISTRVYYKIINRNSGKLLDVENATNADGGNVLQSALASQVNQQWRFVATGDGYYRIVNRNSSKVLDLATNNGNVVQMPDKNEKSQQWKIVDIGGGYYKIVNRSSEKLLEVSGSSIANGGNVIQYTDNGGKNQHWYIVGLRTGNITYTLVREANPTADQLDAYAKIQVAMDSALLYFNSLTNIKKNLTVYYNTSVSTADASINGTIRFGSSRSYMTTCTAMHEIAHTVGVGQSSGWFSLVKNGIFNGANANVELQGITGVSTDQVHGDNTHFWPYGLNYSSEVKSDADYVNQCRIVNQMKKDGI